VTERSTITITFSPALPCSTWHGDRLCGKDATVAQVYPAAGGWLMQPIFCRDCTAALARIYLPPAGEEQAT
jgi:hypothetical protein